MSGRCLRGHLGRCEWSVDWRDVSDVYLTKRPTQVIVETVGAGARSQSASVICWGGVSTVIGSSDCVLLLSTRCEVLASVESLIAFTGKTSNSEDGVPKLRRGAKEVRVRTTAISSAALLLVLGLPAAALETATIRSCYEAIPAEPLPVQCTGFFK